MDGRVLTSGAGFPELCYCHVNWLFSFTQYKVLLTLCCTGLPMQFRSVVFVLSFR